MFQKLKIFVPLHIIILLFSLSGIFTKTAATKEFLSLEFCIFYGLVLVCMAIYAVVWQQVIKRLPLNVAFSNKSVTIIWGMIWGSLFFHEQITPKMIIGALIVIAGVIIVITGSDDRSEEKEAEE